MASWEERKLWKDEHGNALSATITTLSPIGDLRWLRKDGTGFAGDRLQMSYRVHETGAIQWRDIPIVTDEVSNV